MRGCEEEAPFPVFDLNGEMYYRCPLSLITEETAILIRLYRHYRNGYLPVAGGILDQTPEFLRAMEIIEAEVGEQADGSCPLLGRDKGKG